MVQVVITTNSPGETSAWVKPVAKALYNLGVKVDVVVTPCTFASGQETAFLLQQEAIRHVYPPDRYWSLALGRTKIPKEKSGCVLFLGGDIMHAQRLGNLLNYPVAVYSTKRANKNIDLVFVPNQKVKEEVKKRVRTDKIQIVGDLMLSNLTYGNLSKNPRQIALFPGSRHHFQSLLPFFLGVAEKMKEAQSDLEFVVSLSPFIKKTMLYQALKNQNPLLKGVTGRIIDENMLETSAGVKVPFFYNKQYEIMETSAFALTIPGTNTAEMAFYGLPMLVVLPLNIAREIPLTGLAGLIGSIPYLGLFIKERFIWKKAASITATALPNLLANQEVVPELRGFLDLNQVAEVALFIYQDKEKLHEISIKLKELYPKSNAAEIIAETLVRRWGRD